MEENRYDRRSLALAYIEADDKYTAGFTELSSAYNDALKEHRRQLLAGLGRLFGISLEFGAPGLDSGLFFLFRTTANSYRVIRTPTSGILEGGLLIRSIEKSGRQEEIFGSLERLTTHADEYRHEHLDLAETVLAIMLGDRADAVFTADDLRAIDVDPTPPRLNDDPAW